jgi:hypothetical protein
MTMISLEITARVAFEFKPENYPAGFTPDQALALELEQASQDPHEYLALPRTATAVEGRLIADGRMSMARRPEHGRGKTAASDVGQPGH